MIFGISLRFGDFLAKVRYFAGSDAQAEANVLELFAGRLSPSHAGVYLKNRKAEYLTFAASLFADNSFSESRNNAMTSKASQPERALVRCDEEAAAKAAATMQMSGQDGV